MFAPATASLSAMATADETADLSWLAVSAASGHHVQHRLSGDGCGALDDGQVDPCETHVHRVMAMYALYQGR